MIGRDQELSILRERLADLQLPQIACGRRAIIIFEGLDGAGKKQSLKQLAATFDPCHYAVHSVARERREASEGHWLARFWRALPAAGHTSIFYRSWYRRVLDERVLGRPDDAAVARAFDEINEFEAQQRDYGTLLVKLMFEVDPTTQEERLRARAASPWANRLRTENPVLASDPAYVAALADLKAHTDTRWSPWHVMAGASDDDLAFSALATIATAWADAMPAEPIASVA